jgi:hypothetical protein
MGIEFEIDRMFAKYDNAVARYLESGPDARRDAMFARDAVRGDLVKFILEHESWLTPTPHPATYPAEPGYHARLERLENSDVVG